MTIQRILISVILPLWVIVAACSDNTANTTAPAANLPENNHQTPLEQPHSPHTDGLNATAFENFYREFSEALEKRDWQKLADYTLFPLLLKSELDGEPEVTLDKQNFINTIGDLFNEEIYISIGDQLMASNYRDIILNRQQEHVMNDEEVQLFGLRFTKDPDSWKFTGITTHVHIVEKYAEVK